MSRDDISGVLNNALDILFTSDPARSSLGVAFGMVLALVARVFGPALRSWREFIDLDAAPWYGWLCLGILIMHIPTVLSLFKQNPVGDSEIDKVLDLIDRGNFSDQEKRRQYRMLIERASSQIGLKATARAQISEIERQLSDGER